MTKEYCLYIHTCPNGKVYIGITSTKPKYRWDNGNGYDSQVFGNAIKKYGWENIKHEIIYEHLTKEEARVLEIWMIDKYNAKSRDHGYNRTIGGEGNHGFVPTDEQREKMRQRTKAQWANPEIRDRMLKKLKTTAEKRRGRKEPKSVTQKRALAMSIPVSQYTKSGELIASYVGISDAARKLGNVKYNAHISACCREKSKSFHGFVWRYKNEPLTQEYLEWVNKDERVLFKKKADILITD